jgi:dimethylsulfone monooxygenase
MRLGIWTPLPNTVQSEPALDAASIQLSTHGRVGERDLSFKFALDTLSCAEKVGFDLSLIAQRWLGNDPDCFMMASALAASTSKMHIMPALHPGVIPPAVAAKMLSTLDRLAGGRSAINLVSGWWRDEFNMFSNNAYIDEESARFKRMSEYLAVLKGLLENPSFSFDGEFYQLKDAQLLNRPAQYPRPPIYSASRHDAGKELVARECDAWFVPVEPGIDRYEHNLSNISNQVAEMRARAAVYNRELLFGISCHVIIAHSDEEAYRMAIELNEAGKKSRLALISAKALGAGLFGSAETVATRIKCYDEIGVSTFMLHFHPMIDGLKRFGREVMPLLR